MLLVPLEGGPGADELPSTRHPVIQLPAAYDDTWVRDSGPLTAGGPRWLDFRFDGWGGKFPAARDDRLVTALLAAPQFSHLARERFDWVLEGGAVESDGEGTILTTSACLETRAPGLGRGALGDRLRGALGADRVLWLDHGELQGDDTDGHVDTIARFADPATILYQGCDDPNDPHHTPLSRLADQLGTFRQRNGEPYRLLALPLPAACHDGDRRLPAGYANFLIANTAVFMPTYGVPQDAAAAAILGRAFPTRAIVGLDCRVLIRQGGSLHCATMQLPAGTLRP